MTWKTGTIRLETARSVFEGVEFEELFVGGEVAGYKATFENKLLCSPGVFQTLESTSLTDLCKQLWSWQQPRESFGNEHRDRRT